MTRLVFGRADHTLTPTRQCHAVFTLQRSQCRGVGVSLKLRLLTQFFVRIQMN